MEEILKNIGKKIANKYQLDAIGVFGSRARGDHQEYSDYDIFIIGEIKLSDELKIEEELEKALGIEVDVVRLTEETDKFLLKNILNEGILIEEQNQAFYKLYEKTNRFFIENSDFMYFRKRDLLDK